MWCLKALVSKAAVPMSYISMSVTSEYSANHARIGAFAFIQTRTGLTYFLCLIIYKFNGSNHLSVMTQMGLGWAQAQMGPPVQ